MIDLKPAMVPEASAKHPCDCTPAQQKHLMNYRRIWQTIMNLSHIPLLPEWEQCLLAEFKGHSWVQIFEGFGVDACAIDLGSSEVETTVADMLRQGRLYIPN